MTRIWSLALAALLAACNATAPAPKPLPPREGVAVLDATGSVFADEFDAARDHRRLVAIVAPT